MNEEKTEKITLCAHDGDNVLFWTVPSDVKEEINSLPPEERERYLKEISRALIQVARTMATITINRKRYYRYVHDFFRILGEIREAYADTPATTETPKTYLFEA